MYWPPNLNQIVLVITGDTNGIAIARGRVVGWSVRMGPDGEPVRSVDVDFGKPKPETVPAEECLENERGYELRDRIDALLNPKPPPIEPAAPEQVVS